MATKTKSKSKLASLECEPCRGGMPVLKGSKLKEFTAELSPGWKVIKGHHLERAYEFEDFHDAFEFAKRVAKLAEKVNHHPDLYISWGAVKLTLWTHKVNGLTEGDFIFAAKVDELPQ
jgi:4a-hydroxytetrahydrobiopterin dehydratase